MLASEQQLWEARRDTLADSQLATVRRVASVWSGTIGTLTGISIVVTLLTQRDALTKVASGYQIAVAIFFGLAAVFATIAVFRGARASMGNLEPIVGTLSAVRYTTQTEPIRSVHAIKDSMIATMVSTLLLFAGIYVTWLGTARNPPTPTLYLLPDGATGVVYCGRLAMDTRTHGIKLAPDNGVAALIVVDPAKLFKVDACP